MAYDMLLHYMSIMKSIEQHCKYLLAYQSHEDTAGRENSVPVELGSTASM